MIQKNLSPNQNYLYVDSSQQQDHQKQYQNAYLPEINMSDLSYQDSSFTDSQRLNNQENHQKQHKINGQLSSKPKTKDLKMCKVNSDEFLLRDRYLHQLQKIIQENKQKIARKAPLLLTGTDKQIIENLQKRTKNYGYFLKTLQIDKKYNKIMGQKIQNLKKQNQRKKRVVENKKMKSTLRKQEQEMKKYVLDKKLKEQIVIDKIEKYAYKLGIQKIRQDEKKVKTQVKQIQKINDLKVTNLETKQRNKIKMLREELQKIKQTNKVNKLDQKKVITQMEKGNQKDKQFILTKTQSLRHKKFLI